jgi:hypothetical protein
MIGRAPYGHSAVLHAILASERGGSGQPVRETASNGSAGAAPPAGSFRDEREPRAHLREPEGERRAGRH